MNILFACGGTAGHVNPAIALAKTFQLRHPGCNILFVGAEGEMETRLVPKEGYEIRTVTVTCFWRHLSFEALKFNLNSVKNLNKSAKQAREILDDFKPDLVVGTGGYASYPIVNEAAKRGIPTAVHESNAIPGLTTKALSNVVDCVMVGFEESRSHYAKPEKVVVTGTPVRGDFFRYDKDEAKEALNIDFDKPLLLSYWGSLGADTMNQCMVDFIAKEAEEGFPFHHIHGAGNGYQKLMEELEKRNINLENSGVEIREYIYDMPTVMAASDLVLCRAGASTVSEVAALKKPAILVPSPFVTANHQEKNARILADNGGAVLMLEKDCDGEELYAKTKSLIMNPDKLQGIINTLASMSIPDAGEKIYITLRGLMKT